VNSTATSPPGRQKFDGVTQRWLSAHETAMKPAIGTGVAQFAKGLALALAVIAGVSAGLPARGTQLPRAPKRATRARSARASTCHTERPLRFTDFYLISLGLSHCRPKSA
jgi:hypothetical protein